MHALVDIAHCVWNAIPAEATLDMESHGHDTLRAGYQSYSSIWTIEVV